LTYSSSLPTLAPTRHDAAASFAVTAEETADDADDTPLKTA
jgi:hypothetical protein